jgi:hypothetical protein
VTAPDTTERARALLANATPGEWVIEADPNPKDPCDIFVVDAGDAVVAMIDVGEHQLADAELIAAAPTLIADLADEVDRLSAELDRYVQLTTDIDAVRQCWHADKGPNWTANVIESLRHSRLIDREEPT